MIPAGVVKIEPGYWEYRLNWSDDDVMGMSPEQFERLLAGMAALDALAGEVDADAERSELDGIAEMLEGLFARWQRQGVTVAGVEAGVTVRRGNEFRVVDGTGAAP